MYTQLIIIEGMDNTGKTTLIEQYKRIIAGITPDIKVEVIHMEKPPKNLIEEYTEDIPLNVYQKKVLDYNKVNEFQHNAYIGLPDKLKEIKSNLNAPKIIILDRAWLSEYVYGQLYRNRNKKDIIIDNIIIEKKIMDIFGPNNVHLVYLYPENLNFIKHHEDGKSLVVLKSKEIWPSDEETQRSFIDRRLKEELELFNEAFNELTIIKNRIPIQVNVTGSDNVFKNSIIVQMFESIEY